MPKNSGAINKWVYYFFTLVAGIFFFLTVGVVFIRTRWILKERILAELGVSIKAIDGIVDTFIEGRKGRVLDFCSDGIIKDGLTYYDPDGPEVKELTRQINQHLINNKIVLDPYIEDVIVLNLRGRVIFSTNERNLNKDKSEKDYFLKLKPYFKTKGKTIMEILHQNLNLLVHTGDVYISDDLGVPVISISSIVTARATGLPLGVLVNRYRADALNRLLNIEEGQLGKSGKVYIINKDGLLLTAPKYFSQQGKEVILKEKIGALPVIVAQQDMPRILGIYKDFRGVNVLGAAMLMDINDWLVIAEKDAAETFYPLYELTLQIIIIALVSLSLIGAVSFLIAHLEKNIDQKNKQLEESRSQMYQANKMATVGQVASSIVHEINNPLTGVLNNVQLIKMQMELQKDFKPLEFKQLLDVIEESALRCVKTARSMLDFFRLARGKFQPVSLNEVVDKAISLVSYEMKLQNVTIAKSFQPDLPFVSGDPQLLQQAVFDIINNAKYAIQKNPLRQAGLPAGQAGMISIRTQAEQGKDTVMLSISDNGIGIPKENMDKLFKPFFTTKPIGEGTGLGLSIIHDIVVRHSGKIEVESQEGQGATFKLSFPILWSKG